ncbi:MAG TPA: DUF356 domain-containing protein [Methanosarcina sp.]|jgi:hypothetical protein|uniref:DUF356 domain-containing protein n=1 Tax=Methanosarcina spelaei TaxID=1036679 RepID=A0A2A2HP68_9EURY|nr:MULTISPECIES: DUF356 domain-containing protein [Methanosarcina]MDW5550295.1 DUF356 domain-containing protein [Methanosarcina sp.]MDW5554123.1 DUF356 domain-containing protein [Methanosarcina sp.]MDW5560318.1 DUF356 domain-containing protein [Methanosarcina sp.]PAV11076.1 hypothetical protein ASJ81_11390 [Methanosarcina spelaei]HII93420.1 DUF356 domain-containing protein [Methanosarcina sp.]
MIEKTNSFALIRGENEEKILITLNDLKEYGDAQFSTLPKVVTPEYADKVLIRVMGGKLKKPCSRAVVVGLETPARVMIRNLRTIHPPAHVVIISPFHEDFRPMAAAYTK